MFNYNLDNWRISLITDRIFNRIDPKIYRAAPQISHPETPPQQPLNHHGISPRNTHLLTHQNCEFSAKQSPYIPALTISIPKLLFKTDLN